MAQSIVKKHFPLLGGLQNTLLQEQIIIGCTVNTIQIVHCNKRKHWVTVTSKWCQRNKVNVYDTLFNKLDFETKRVIKKMFALKKAGDINMVPVQKQQGSKDCGVFAIAIMTSLALMKIHLVLHTGRELICFTASPIQDSFPFQRCRMNTNS